MPITINTDYKNRKRTSRYKKFKRIQRSRNKKFKKKLALRPHRFVERVEDKIKLDSNTLQANGTLLVNYKRTFQMSDIPQWASYQKLFDDYILNKVVVELRYNQQIATYTSTTPIVNEIKPLLLIKTDHNDASTGFSWDDMKQSEKARLVQMDGGKVISHVIKPAVQKEAYKTAVASAYCPAFDVQIRTIDDTVPHYGLKIQVQTAPGPAVYDFGNISLMFKYYFTMKNAE